MLYDALIEHLKRLGFEFDPPLAKRPRTDREDPSKNTIKGLVSSANAGKILQNFNVASLLLVPEGFRIPEDPKQIVRVRIELPGGLPPDRQRELAEQTLVLLRDIGFFEAVGYDHHGLSGQSFTRLLGAIPAGWLDALLKDVRGHPAGWFGPRIAREDLPMPLRGVNPIRIIEVLPDLEPLPALAFPGPRPREFLEKISPDLWALAEEKGKEDHRVRIDILLAGEPGMDNAVIRDRIRDLAPGIFIEGQTGQTITAQASRGFIKALSEMPEISALRLTRTAQVDADPAVTTPGGDNAKALALSGLENLHKRGARGKGVRLAIIDTDFRGWEKMVKDKKLPAATRLVDLTAERSLDLLPAPYPANGDRLGHGTQCALAAALAAPEAELVLIRISDVAPHQLAEVAHYLRGERLSDYLELRRDELTAAKARVDAQRETLQRDRREVLEDFTDDLEIMRDFEFLGPVRGWIFSKRDWIGQRLERQRKLEAQLAVRNQRFFEFMELVKSLKGIPIAVNSLNWNDGFPLGGTSSLSKALGASTSTLPLWIQAVGNTRGQAWSGLFRDDNGDGVMQFAPGGALPKERERTSELSFIGWRPYGKEELGDLPAGARIRVTMQWREPHDPDYYLRPGDEDYYRKPLAALRLILLRQRDPEGKKVPADAFDVAAISVGYPQRLEHLPNSSVYEIAVEFTVAKAGRYALRVQRAPAEYWLLIDDAERGRPALIRIQGPSSAGIRPAGAASLPALERNWELNLRLFVDVLSEHRLQGRPVFIDYSTDQGTVGLPADARNVVSVGAADFDGKTRPYSATGALPYSELSRRPTILAFDSLQVGKGGAHGTSISASFAAGTIAAMLSSGMTIDNVRQLLHKSNGQLLRAIP